MKINKFKAGDTFPVIELPTLGGTTIQLGTPQNGASWRMVVVYRGKHCPLCTRYLNELESLKNQFLHIGVDIVAVSADSEAQAKAHRADLAASFPIAYGLSIEQMQLLGLYISHPRSDQETDHPFAEPGLYVINDKNQVQVLDISNGPFARPELNALLSGLTFIRNPENHYPIRGTYEINEPVKDGMIMGDGKLTKQSSAGMLTSNVRKYIDPALTTPLSQLPPQLANITRESVAEIRTLMHRC